MSQTKRYAAENGADRAIVTPRSSALQPAPDPSGEADFKTSMLNQGRPAGEATRPKACVLLESGGPSSHHHALTLRWAPTYESHEGGFGSGSPGDV